MYILLETKFEVEGAEIVENVYSDKKHPDADEVENLYPAEAGAASTSDLGLCL